MSVERVTLDEFNSVASRPPEELEAHSWRRVDLLKFADSPPEPPAIGGLVYPGRRHVFSGEPETLKSWAALVLCVEQMRAGRTVVYVDFEMGAAMMLERLRQLGLSDEEIRAGFVYLAPSEPMTGEEILADVMRMLAFAEPSLVVLDAFTGALELHGCDPVSGVAIEGFYRTVVAPLQAHGAAVVLLDHVAKNRESRGKFAIDSQRKVGGVDVHLGFRLVRPFARGKDGLASITTHKDRPGHLPRPRAAELELTSDPETFAVGWRIRPAEVPVDNEGESWRPTRLMEKVSLYVGGLPEAPSRNQVEKNVTGSNEYLRVAMDALVREGYLDEVDGSRGARLLRFLRPFRESEEWDES